MFASFDFFFSLFLQAIRDNPGFIQLRRIEATKEVSESHNAIASFLPLRMELIGPMGSQHPAFQWEIRFYQCFRDH